MASSILLLVVSLALEASGTTVRSPLPPMGWNSYNSWNCDISEEKIHQSAQGLVDLGLADLGYKTATIDCGWMLRDRDAEGRLQWNETNFPAGGKAMGDFMHNLGLKFGMYSGAGHFQCGSTDLPASLGFERIDAESFAGWGADSLKYDNCYSTSKTVMVDSSSAESQSPARFQLMAAELDDVDRDIQYYICQWGIGENVGAWAKKIGTTWRMSNDIYNAWRSIWRITNQIVPYFRYTESGAFADMDMLIIGLNALSTEEERFHFGMWAINKSPLVIGAALDHDRLSEASLEIMSNKEVIAINQDSLVKQAQIARRYTEEQWDIWMGDLSGSRKVLGVANWNNDSQSVNFDLASLGVASANVRDVWAAKDLGVVSGSQDIDLTGHELRLWVLSDIVAAKALTSAAYHDAAHATLSGSAHVVSCPNSTCLPTGNKVENVVAGASIKFANISAQSAGKKLMAIDFINYDYAFTTAWGLGDNIRNMTIAVNGGKSKRWGLPLSGLNWHESGRLLVEADGFKNGTDNVVTFATFGNSSAPDLVGFEVLE